MALRPRPPLFCARAPVQAGVRLRAVGEAGAVRRHHERTAGLARAVRAGGTGLHRV